MRKILVILFLLFSVSGFSQGLLGGYNAIIMYPLPEPFNTVDKFYNIGHHLYWNKQKLDGGGKTYIAGYRIRINDTVIHNTSYWGNQDSVKTTLTGILKATAGKLTTIFDSSYWWNLAYNTTLTFISFPGFGTDHTHAAYGDHDHAGLYAPLDSIPFRYNSARTTIFPKNSSASEAFGRTIALQGLHFGKVSRFDSTLFQVAQVLGNCGAGVTVDWRLGQTATVIRNASTVITMVAPTSVPNATCTLTLFLVHEASSTAYTVTFSPVPKVLGGGTLSYTNTTGATDIIVFKYLNGTYHCYPVGNDFK